MTDLRQHLHDLVDRAPVGPAPIEAMLEARTQSRRFALPAGLAFAALVIAAIVLVVPMARQSSLPDSVGPSDRVVTVIPREVVRGAQVQVTVTGLEDSAGAEVDLSAATVGASREQGVGSGRIDDQGRLSIAMTMPSSLGHETPVTPGEYRLVFAVQGPKVLRFDHPVHVIAAIVGEKYLHVPTYDCLDYTWFDGRLWKFDGGNVKRPVSGAMFSLVSRDLAVYDVPDGRTATFRAASPAAFDTETFTCPTEGPGHPSTYEPPVRTTSILGAPTKLPAIASLKDSWMYNNGAVHHEYSLAGPENADTATPEAIASDPTSPAVHPATYLTVSFNPEVGKNAVIGEGKLQIPADPRFDNIRTVDVNGAIGKLTTSKNGLGVTRLDWIDAAGNYHVVKVDRLKTSDGISGLSASQILAIGRSIK